MLCHELAPAPRVMGQGDPCRKGDYSRPLLEAGVEGRCVPRETVMNGVSDSRDGGERTVESGRWGVDGVEYDGEPVENRWWRADSGEQLAESIQWRAYYGEQMVESR